ncbi:helix-turn-helix domain-containing protein [Enterococcus thailandicus]|uniref:helix-turn-helix domain-containing protein n=1 Tax=Enterococcus thailandicus TaxID=417368 RepID=UPI0022E65967|nr:helix-turn-helix domain-containing protein [Enterococcus thailandicus]
MNYEFFLSKEDHRSYSLLKYLEESSNLSEPILKIQEELSLSTFLLKKTIENLNYDIETLGLNQHLKIQTTGTEVSLEIDGKYSSGCLLSNYIKRSIYLDLLIEFFREDYTTLEVFADEHHISYSSAYTILQELKKVLKKHQIFFDKKRLYGNKINITIFYYQLFLIADIPYQKVYPDATIETVSEFVCLLSQEFSLSVYEKKKLFHYFSVHLLAEKSKSLEINQNILSFFSTAEVEKMEQLLEPASKNFVYVVLIWLYLNDKLIQKYVKKNEDEMIKKLNDHFIQNFEKRFKPLTEEIVVAIRRELSKIHFNVLCYPINKFAEFTINIYFFRQNYPEFYFYLLDYINLMTAEYKELSRDKVFLFFSYLMLIINHVPVQLISDSVKVGIDFSYGSAYNQFIKKNLGLYINLNVEVVDDEQSAYTDVVITNMNNLYGESSPQVVVWLNPPRPVDWGNLTKILLKIQEEKYKNGQNN